MVLYLPTDQRYEAALADGFCYFSTVGSRLSESSVPVIVNTGRISDLVQISEQPVNLTVLHNCGHDQ